MIIGIGAGLTETNLVFLLSHDISPDTFHRYRLAEPPLWEFVQAAQAGTSPYHTSIRWQKDQPPERIDWGDRRAGILRYQCGDRE